MKGSDLDRRYETRDVSARMAAFILLAIFIAAVAMHLSLAYGLRRLRDRFGGTDAATAFRAREEGRPEPGSEAPSSPRLETSEAVPLDLYVREQRRRLQTYEWIDRTHGIARIPIERAMEIDAKRK